MSNAPDDEYFYLGALVRVHGLDGTLKAMLDTDEPARYTQIKKIWVKRQDTLEAKVVARFRLVAERAALIRFKGTPDSAESAMPYVGAGLHLPLSFLPPLPQGGFYYHDVIGFEVRDVRLGAVGKVIKVVENPAHDLIVFAHGFKERYLPVVNEFVLDADMNERVLRVQLPDGLLDL